MGRKSIFKFIVSAAILFFCGIVSLHAQTTVVSGKVTDSSNEGIVGASVYVKGTTTGVSTDFDGNYSLTIDGIKDPVLVFSCLGYGEQEVTVGKQTKINVVLAEESNALDEVVFVAYGTMRKGDVTGALTTIKPDDNDMAMPSINSLLEGKIAGLVVNSSSSQVGAASSVTIRGANSLRGDNQPLYVIDNIPQASTGEFSTSAIGGTDFQVEQDPLSSLNPADIVDITVLKDASSTAIYGSRGANGVILITTRKGSEGTVRVHVNANFTVTQPTRLMDMMNLAQYADYRNSRLSNVLQYRYHVVGNEVRYNYSGSESSYNAGDPSSYHILYERDWQKEIYTSAFSHQYNVSVDGGSDKVTYYVSAGFKDIKGTVKQTGLYEGSLRINLSAKLARTVTLDFMANGSIRQNDMMAGGNTTGGATGAVSRTALDYPPYLMSEDDPDYSNENTTTVLSWLDDYVDKAVNKTFNGSINLRWDISKNFHYSLRTGGNMTTNDRKRWYGMSLYQGMNNQGLLAISNLHRSNWTVENLIMYNGKVGDWLTIDATAGVTYDQYYYLNENTKANSFTFFDLRENGLSVAGNVEHPTPDQKDYQLLSYLARVNLSFLDKYLVTASFRADGSSKFAKGNRWGYFPSASIAWRMEQEPWLKDVDAVSQLKIRLSYGVTGNQSIDPYTTISQYGQLTTGDVVYADPNGNSLTTMIVTNLSNSSLKWEKTASWNLGVDFGFFKHRLDGTLDLYSKKTSDLLISRTLPGSAGFASTYYNQGGMSNKGFEITLTGVPIDTKDWTWQISGNIGLNRAKITDLGLEETDFGCLGSRVGYYGNTIGDHFGVVNIFLAGEAPGLFLGYETQGIVQYSDLTTNGVAFTKPDGTTGYYSTFEGSAPAAGDIKFVDQNGDGVIDTNDRTIIGDPNPDFTYGFSTKVAYKNLSLSISFNGVQGVDRYNTNTRYINTPSQKAGSLTKTAYLNMWRDDNEKTYYSNTYPSSTFVLANCSMDRYVEDASYLRCSDITLSYTFPKRWMKQIGFYGLNLSFSAKNAFIITKYSGYDPEVNSFAFDGLRPGIDMNSYPNPRSYILSVNITF